MGGNGGYRKNSNVFSNGNSGSSEGFGDVDQTKLNNMDDIDSFMS